jgi:hypothetical protein
MRAIYRSQHHRIMALPWFLRIHKVRIWIALSIILSIATQGLVTQPSSARDQKPEAPEVSSALVSWEYDQIHASLANNSLYGGYLAVWEDHHWGYGADWDIYGRLIDSNGVPSGSDFGISYDGSQQRQAPDVAYNSNNNEYLVVYEYTYSSVDHDIYAQRVAANGSLIGGNFAVESPSDYDANPAIAYNSTRNEYLVVWQRKVGADEFTQFDIYAKRLDWGGATLGTSFALTTAAHDQTNPDVAFDSSNDQYLAAWQSYYGVGDWDILGRLVSGSGSLPGSELLIGYLSGWQAYPSLAFNNSYHEFLVAWEDHIGGDTTNWDIRGRRVDSTGANVGSVIEIATTGDNIRARPAVAYKGFIGEYMVAYQYAFTPTDDDLYVTRLDIDGTPLAEYYLSRGSANERIPAIASDTSYYYQLVWEDYRNAGTLGIDLYTDRAAVYRLSGYVYEGYPYNTGSTMPYVPLSLYCANDPESQGYLLANASSSHVGYYAFYTHVICEYYNILETVPDGYVATGVQTTGGNPRSNIWIQYTYPLDGKTLSGNNFWIAHPIPTAPTNVLASDGTYTERVQVTWSSSAGATYYEVHRATSSGGTKSLLGSPAASPYDDTTAAVGTTYYYWVKACNSWGCSDFSAYDTGYRSGTPPTAPTNVLASDGTYTERVQVTWSSSAGATYYEVHRATSSGGTKSLLGSPAASPYDDTTAAVGTTYYYWVKACNSWGCSDFSAYDTGYRSDTPPIGGNLEVTKIVDWNGGTPVTGKTFEICITGPSYPTLPNCQTTGYLGGILNWSNLIPGSYTVSETDPGSEWTVSISGSPATVPEGGGQVTASVTNTLKQGSISGRVILERRTSNAGAIVSITNLTQPTNPDGTFMIENLPTGLITVTVTCPGYLASWREVTVLAGQIVNLPDVVLLAGDVNQDGSIELADSQLIGYAWNATPGSPNWDIRADLNNDGQINILDMVAVQFNWGKIAPCPW